MRDGTHTRERIERAALRLFVQRGIAETSIRDISIEAGVSQGAMYTHFESKEELAWHLFAESFSEIGSELQRLARDDTALRDKLRAMIHYVFQSFDHDWESVTYVFLARHAHLKNITRRLGNPYVAFRTVIAQEMRRGRIPRGNIDVAASMVTGSIIQVIDIRILDFIKAPLVDQTDQVTDGCLAIIQG
jgi:AcrR family transcriptional regulator